MSLTAPKHRTFPDEIVEQLRERILRGEFPPGSRLPPERELAVRLGTNRNTLREALRSLEAQGLVQARQGDGVRVLDFRATGEMSLLQHYFLYAAPVEQASIMRDLLRLRSMLAREVVGRAAQRGAPAELERLPGLYRTLAAAHGDGDTTAMIHAELTLYRAIVDASQSLAGRWLFNSLERVIMGFLSASPGLWVTPESYLPGWRKIVEGLVARNAEGALRALDELFGEIDSLVTAFLDALEGAGG